MALAQVAAWRPHPGRYEDFIKVCHEARKIQKGLGAEVRIWQSQVGSNAGTVLYVIQHADGAAYGKFIDKLNAEPAWQQLVASFQKNPPAEPVESSLIQELP
jgi:hypothetical protein